MRDTVITELTFVLRLTFTNTVYEYIYFSVNNTFQSKTVVYSEASKVTLEIIVNILNKYEGSLETV